MNFTPFSGQFQSAAAAAMPTIHQFAAKFGYDGGQETRYPVQLVDGVKFRPAEGLVVVTAAQPVALATMPAIHTVNTGVKYQTISASSSMNLGNIAYGGQTSYVQAEAVQLKERDKREYRDDHHDIMATMMHQHQVTQTVPMQQGGQQLVVVLHEPKEAAAIARAIKQEVRPDRNSAAVPAEFISIGDVSDSSTWQSLGGGVADYLSTLPLPLHHLLKYSSPNNTVIEKREEPPTVATPVSTTPLPSINTLAKQRFAQIQPNTVNSVVVQTTTIVNQNISASPPLQNIVAYTNNNNNNNINANTNNNINNNVSNVSNNSNKKKKKRRGSGTNVRDKPERARPGEIRLTTALDGSTLYCCPECHMAYPERGLLEQHLLGHTMERRYICDICNAALKRKDHLTRHKQSHNPERPHVCSVCLKAFKRKEQLTLHFVIHSGEKRHVCNECGKGFYRKDHLRKHSRSHIARRVKAELSQTQASSATPAPATPAPLPPALTPDGS